MFDYTGCYLKAINFYDAYDYDSAEETYRTLLKESESGKDQEHVILAIIGFGNVFRRRDRQDEAIIEFDRAKKLAEEILENAKTSSLNLTLKDKLEMLDKYRVLIAKALIGRGHALRVEGKSHESLKAHKDAIQSIKDSDPDFSKAILARANAYIGVGTALRHSDLITDAFTAYNHALGQVSIGLSGLTKLQNDETTERLKHQFSQAQANALIGRGDAKRKLNLIDDAIADYSLALNEFNDIKNYRVMLKALRSRGITYLMKDNPFLVKAKEDFEAAIEICVSKKCEHCLAHANARMGKGHVFRRENNYDGALGFFQEARKDMRYTRHQKAHANALIGIAETQELQTWYSRESCPSKKNRIAACINNFTLAIMLGRKIGYGFAIIRGQAGLRRLRNAEVKCSVDCQFKPATPDDWVEGCKPSVPRRAVANRSEEELILRSHSIKRHIEKIFGVDSLRKFPREIEDMEAYYHSFLPNYETRTWTVSLMCDIRGYTTVVSQAPPEDQFYLLDRFLKRVTQIIQKNGGGVDKYMGDAVLGFYLPTTLNSSPNDEECRKNTVVAAIKSALEIVNDPELKSCFELFANTTGIVKKDRERLGIGIGIALGLAKFGEIGASCHREYTAIGRPVNLASRLQTIAPEWKVLCTDSCWRQLVPDSKASDSYDDSNAHFKANLFPIPLEKEIKGHENLEVWEISL